MLSVTQLLAILPAFIAVTSAAPVQRDSAPTLSATMDIVQWAQQISKDWKSPANAQAQRTAYINGSSYLVLDYTLKYENCGQAELIQNTLSDGIYCPSDTPGVCSIQRMESTSSSDSYHLGTKVGISITAGASAEVVSFSETISAEFSQDYTWTNTTTSSTEYTFPISPGKTCLPTEVYWTSTCTQSIEIDSFKWYGNDGQIMWPETMGSVNNICSMWQSPKSTPPSGPPANSKQWLLAGDNRISGNFENDLGSHFDLITEICAGVMPAPVNMQLDGSGPAGAKMGDVGCMYQ